MTTSVLNLRFQGAGSPPANRYDVEVYNGGQLVIHTSTEPDGHRTHLISAWGGPHALNTLHELDVQVLRGPCRLDTATGKPRRLRTNGRISLAPGTAFSVTARGATQLLCSPRPGPGLGSQGAANPILR